MLTVNVLRGVDNFTSAVVSKNKTMKIFSLAYVKDVFEGRSFS